MFNDRLSVEVHPPRNFRKVAFALAVELHHFNLFRR